MFNKGLPKPRTEKVLLQELCLQRNTKDLKVTGEKWMKDTATSCMFVATLVASVVFAAAFTVPGSNREDTGLPFFLEKISLKDFCHIRCDTAGILLCLNSELLVHSHLAVCRRRFPPVVAKKVAAWTCNTFHIYSRNDGCVFYNIFHSLHPRKVVDCYSCYRNYFHAGHLVYLARFSLPDRPN